LVTGSHPLFIKGGGKLRNLIEIYVNHESAYPDELKKSTRDEDEIYLTFMLAGG
jgi:hypothetical protein